MNILWIIIFRPKLYHFSRRKQLFNTSDYTNATTYAEILIEQGGKEVLIEIVQTL